MTRDRGPEIPREQASTLIGSDADAARERVLDVAGADVRVVAEYSGTEYQLLHVDEAVVEDYGGEAGLRQQAERLYSYINVDFVERQLFGDIAPRFGEVETLVTRMSDGIIVRHFVGDCAFYVGLQGDADVDHVIDVLQAELGCSVA
jgi:hypothetical protein